ncbi:hypothetical protein GH714_031525 [Hevea brasiliensis]|uniref:3'-5' exonuclease domain-containing protein n=1 Tax=Hevea brasiliensis TaxID=3981 RepID=A0A6A6LD23_HEVBR|nr:hypothetical protein GH714_031525 [Hevea brasiliensis]
MDSFYQKSLIIHLVTSSNSPEFTLLNRALTRSSVIGLDAEWKPIRARQSTFPTVSLLQLACQLRPQLGAGSEEPVVFLLDLSLIPLPSIWELLREVEPYLDITRINHFLQHKQRERKTPKETKSLASICNEVLGISLSKELQCSDWSCRPLTEEQKTYAAIDAHCLLEIFKVFQANVVKEGKSYGNATELHSSNINLGLKEILEKHDIGDAVIRTNFSEA